MAPKSGDRELEDGMLTGGSFLRFHRVPPSKSTSTIDVGRELNNAVDKAVQCPVMFRIFARMPSAAAQ